MTTAQIPSSSVRFRGRSLMALVLRPEPPIEDWLTGLDSLIGRSPGYFMSRPVVADVSALQGESSALIGLMDELNGRNIRVMAIEGTDAASLGSDARWLPPVVSGSRPAAARPGSDLDKVPVDVASGDLRPDDLRPDVIAGTPPDPVALARPVPSLLIEKPVRSGQSINFAEGDVTILGSVSSGAEILAGGSIHIYGALRGRAMAGFTHKDGRIFCSRLHAELLAIDGIYKTADEMDAKFRGRPIQAWNRGDTLVIAGLI